MTMHHNVYSQKGCSTCKPCAKGGGNVGRNAVLLLIILFTAGLGLLILPFFKKCQFCGHNHFMNKHGSTTSGPFISPTI